MTLTCARKATQEQYIRMQALVKMTSDDVRLIQSKSFFYLF